MATIFYVPPQNQGQAVEVAYAGVDGWVIRRTTERNCEPEYHISKRLASDQTDYWQNEPQNKRWRSISALDAWNLLGG